MRSGVLSRAIRVAFSGGFYFSLVLDERAPLGNNISVRFERPRIPPGR